MKTALLINPWIYDFAAYDLWLQPWGLMKLASVLQREGYTVQLLDLMDRHHPLLPDKALIRSNGTGPYQRCELPKPSVLATQSRRWNRFGMPLELFQHALPEVRPDIILITSGMTYWYPGVFDLIAMLRQRWPGVSVILGGTYATLMPEHASTSGADLVIGNGELERLSVELNLSRSYGHQELLEELLCNDFHPHAPYAVLKLSHGCPYRCDYCAQQLLAPEFIQRSCESALAELEQLTAGRIRHFAFYDDALLYDRDYLHNFLEEVMRLELPLQFHTPNGLHARLLDQDTAHLLRHAGFVRPVLSLETAQDTDWHSKVTVPELEAAIGCLRRAGYEAGAYMVYLLLGAPGCDEESLTRSIDLVHLWGARISLSEFSPIPGTVLGERFSAAMAEPLLQNNTIFPVVAPELIPVMQRLKNRVKQLNSKFVFPTQPHTASR
ncbi:MAG: cobalamin-dependent protein [Candidatus Delongbacteria bacterium]|nr:cobalamin-dependent protein [Candidatus Delongbacteria bacterium]